MRSPAAIALLLLCFALHINGSTRLPSSLPNSPTNDLRVVQKIYVGDMGSDDEAERFRLLLAERLVKRGFTVVNKPEAADAVLTGALAVRVFDDNARARVSVQLHAADGTLLWSRDFGSSFFRNTFTLTEPVKRRADEVAKALRNEWGKEAKRISNDFDS